MWSSAFQHKKHSIVVSHCVVKLPATYEKWRQMDNHSLESLPLTRAVPSYPAVFTSPIVVKSYTYFLWSVQCINDIA